METQPQKWFCAFTLWESNLREKTPPEGFLISDPPKYFIFLTACISSCDSLASWNRKFFSWICLKLHNTSLLKWIEDLRFRFLPPNTHTRTQRILKKGSSTSRMHLSCMSFIITNICCVQSKPQSKQDRLSIPWNNHIASSFFWHYTGKIEGSEGNTFETT